MDGKLGWGGELCRCYGFDPVSICLIYDPVLAVFVVRICLPCSFLVLNATLICPILITKMTSTRSEQGHVTGWPRKVGAFASWPGARATHAPVTGRAKTQSPSDWDRWIGTKARRHRPFGLRVHVIDANNSHSLRPQGPENGIARRGLRT